jgi:ATP-dependent Clp protease protease subunit
MSDIIHDISEGLSDQIFQKEFLKNRQIFLWGSITDGSSRDLINKMLWLASQDSKKDITMYINSPGGIISSGMAIVDCMEMVEPDISTICMGLAASMGAILLVCGKKGKRFVWPHGKVMLHQPLISGQIVAPALDIKIQADEIKKTKQKLNQILADKCGKTLKQIEADTDRDFYMTAEEAVEYGIADSISKKI